MSATAARRLTVAIPDSLAALTLRERVRFGEPVNVLIARVGSEYFALDLLDVQEAVDADDLHVVPTLGAGALGVVTWRGAAHTVWSPTGVLRAELERADTALFLRTPRAMVAMAVDDVEELMTVSGRDVRMLSGVDDAGGLVVGGLHFGHSLATLVDVGVLADALRGRGGEDA